MEASTPHTGSANWPEEESDELMVHSDPTAVRRARSFARRLAGGLPAETDDTIELLVAELVTNALLHGAPPVILRIETVPDRVRIAVADASPRLPLARVPQAEDVTGRGLQVVEALSAGWGVRSRPEGGKVVWADVSKGPSSRPAGVGARPARARTGGPIPSPERS